MNVYDFDKTIYDGDCTIDFYLFAVFHHPRVLFSFPKQLLALIRYKLKLISKVTFKEEFFSFLLLLDNIDIDIEEFWGNNKYKIKNWYLQQKKDDDVIISASPYFLLSFICNELKIKTVIASEVNPKNGKFCSPNCYGDEKVIRFYSQFDKSVDFYFYSDSKSDTPMSKQAKKSFLVKKDKIIEWVYDN